MTRYITLLLVLIMSLLLGFFCVKRHQENILTKLVPQQKIDERKIVDVEKIKTEPTPTHTSVQLIQSVERAEPIVKIKVDNREPTKPVIKKMSTDDLFDKKRPPIQPITIEKIKPTPTPTPTPTKNTPNPIEKSMRIENKTENTINNEMSEIERQMLEEMKNFK